MLSNRPYVYKKDLYDIERESTVTSKSSESNIKDHQPKLTLKIELLKDKSRTYYANRDILRSDSEKKVAMVTS